MNKLFQSVLKKLHRRPKLEQQSQPDAKPIKKNIGSYAEDIRAIKAAFQGCDDIKLRELAQGTITDSPVFVSYIESLVKTEWVEMAFSHIHTLTDPESSIRPNETSGSMDVVPLQTVKDAIQYVLDGWTVFIVQKTNCAYAVNTYFPPTRNIDRSEAESVILGPQEAFNESIQINLSLLRKRLKSTDLKVSFTRVGRFNKKFVAILHLESIAPDEYVDSITERINRVDIDALTDSGELAQLLDDNPYSPFPQFHMTERPERIVSHLCDGKVVVFSDGSPFALSGPASFIEFFQTSEDYDNRWLSASVIRTLRLVGVLISISLSALYVAVVTYHYQLIPTNMLVTLTQSRARVPFPPLYETLLMETTIELLREAGARLPTKVGQTIGIVGGIVIGQAAVTAGLTSNILIISVALSTVASFITPSYIMSSALRAIRFPLILLAGWWGLYGMFIGYLMLILHFLRLSSLGAPYFTPFAPLRLVDWKDTFLRVPLPFLKYRPTNTMAKDNQRMPFTQEVTPTALSPTEGTSEKPQGSDPS
ncbi:spore germination protein [Tumebacillus permanentifrigoris]|uniref:GerA spore germination protein n=1 Tax=Tumebacillus permanentifrigoris TaxID=378543 RepID=A0A316DEB1_9BACL|nr:spore germination protein [Tumebacillus permanentifrigoris]PWK16295.1 GerA spore germination protein [Tumebacillus permanentifrigoris]